MFDKEKKYFPIKSNTACPLKWTWSTVWLRTGETASCFRCEKLKLDKNNFKNFHNLPGKINERKIMLENKWPTVENGGAGYCNYCKKIEDAGGTSDRMHHLTIPNLSPQELDIDTNALHVTPKILEIFLNNTCNLKCTYCRTKDSSQIEAEVQKFGDLVDLDGNKLYGFKKKNHIRNETQNLLPVLLEWLEENGSTLRRIHFLGGETFYQKELQSVLDVLKKIKNKHLELNIVSNLMVKEDNYKNYISQLEEMLKNRQIGRFDLTASIDGWGAEAEYARFGLQCDHWLKLFQYSFNKKWIKININQTITSLTIKSMPELFSIMKPYAKKRLIEMHIGLVINRPWMHPEIFGQDFWKNDFDKIVESMPNNHYRDTVLKKYMEGVYLSLPKIDPNRKQVLLLKHFLDQLDKRRDTNWRSIYPYLDI